MFCSNVDDYDMATRERVLKKRVDVPGYDASRYTVRRLMAPARDGVQVPMSIVYRADRPKDGKGPLWLYAYGSYGNAMPATFSTVTGAISVIVWNSPAISTQSWLEGVKPAGSSSPRAMNW
jgi:protease II